MTKAQKMKLFDKTLYCITAENFSKGRDNVEVVKAMLEGGARIIQYREKKKSMKEKYEQCAEISTICKEAGALFIVNDHAEIALAVEADGVHIGQDDMPCEPLRKVLGYEMIIGLSTHSAAQAEDAVKRGADYIGVGPIFKTYTKDDVCEPVGLDYLRYAAAEVKVPFVTIGGIKTRHLDELIKLGARCVSMVTEICAADDIVDTVRSANAKLG